LPNFIKRKHPRDGEKKETTSKDQSLGKQTVQKRQATGRKRDPLRTRPSTEEFMKPTEIALNLTNWKGAVLGMRVLCEGLVLPTENKESFKSS
jgi:hypothetical protein